MGTANFKYENRCIVVTDEDYEFDNVPEHGKVLESSYSFTTCELLPIGEKYEILDKLQFLNLCITNGYYEGACIDYIENDTDIIDCIGYYRYCEIETKKALIDTILDVFKYAKLSKNSLNKAIGKVKGLSADDWMDDALSNIYNLVLEREKEICNKALDQIKEDYGYEEYGCVGHFSNGEALYEKIG